MLPLQKLALLLALTIPLAACDDSRDAPSARSEKEAESPRGAAANGGKPADAARPGPAQSGAASPQEAFAQLQKAANERDYRAFFLVLHPESQNMMLVGALMGAAITLAPVGTKPNPDKKKELDGIFAKYGVKDDGSAVKPKAPAQMMAEVGKKLEGVNDRHGLFHDLMLYLEKNSLAQERPKVHALEKLVEVSADKATATIVMKHDSGKLESKPVELRRENGRWFVFVTQWS